MRSPETGDVEATALDGVTTSTSLDEHGAVQTFESLFMGSPVYGYAVTHRDGQGRILEMVETIGSETRTRWTQQVS